MFSSQLFFLRRRDCCDERRLLLKSPANKKMEGNKKQVVSPAQMLKGLRRGYLNEA